MKEEMPTPTEADRKRELAKALQTAIQSVDALSALYKRRGKTHEMHAANRALHILWKLE